MTEEPLYVVCETIHAITTHLRVVTDDHPIRFGGHSTPRPQTLCGRDVGWDTTSPVGSVGCIRCSSERSKFS